MQNGQRAFHSKPGFARIAWIEEQNTVDHLVKGFVSMAEDHYIRLFPSDASLGRIAEILRVNYMVDENLAPGELDYLSQIVMERRVIRVPRDCGDGRDLLQLQQNPWKPNVAGVQNMLDALEQARNFRIEEIMRVGNDTDFCGMPLR